MKKSYLALALVAVLIVVGMVACGQAQNHEEQQDPQNLSVQQTEPVDTAEPEETQTPEPTVEPTPEPTTSALSDW